MIAYLYAMDIEAYHTPDNQTTHQAPNSESTLLDSPTRIREWCKKLSAMTEEERMMLTMSPKEKEFYLKFKQENPGKEGEYFPAFAKKEQEEYQRTGKI